MGRVNATEPSQPVPLARLLAIAYRSLVDGLHGRLRDQGWVDVRPAFGFVLLAARDQPTTSTALATLMGTTKQAASKLVDSMQDAGYVERSANGPDGRQRHVSLTPRGVQLVAAAAEIYTELEREWASLIGPNEVERIRRGLTGVLSDDHGVLPPVRPTW